VRQVVRVDHKRVLPDARKALLGLDAVGRQSTLEPALLELVRVRASQINGCAYCLELHTNDARARGEDERRLHVLAAWRHAACFTPRERAALAWCEAITLLPQTGAPDELYEDLEPLFSPQEIVALTVAIAAINAWNRLAVATGMKGGLDVPAEPVSEVKGGA
jgi:AhpD family alkylhydroperoxidase